MGADIYLQSVSKRVLEEWEPKFKAACRVRDALGVEPERNRDAPFTVVGPPEYVAAQAKVTEAYSKMYSEGYFRDSYNSWSLFWLLGLSWWGDVGERLVEGDLGADGLAWLRAELEARDVPSEEELIAYFSERDIPVGGEGEEDPKELRQYYKGQKQELIALITQAQELGEPLYCSV